jgi:nicotinamide phosphoribosyltransferase
MRAYPVPLPLEADAYQIGHFRMIPPGMEDFECSQAIFRKPLGDFAAETDYRIVAAGVLPFVQLELSRRLTRDAVNEASWFLEEFCATPRGAAAYPFPRVLFERIVDEFDGRWPICVTALRDGQAHVVGEPHVQIWTDEPGMGEAVGWIESTMLPYLWTSSTVATRGRRRKARMREVYRQAYPSRDSDALLAMIEYKFHDFGRRGGAATQITGLAHLLNWLGTDTVDAAYVATRHLNGGKKFGAMSIPAAAHRTVTPWPTEDQAIDHMIAEFGDGIFSFVADSYGYARGIRKLAGRASVIKAKGGILVGRPDSGDPVDCVLEGLTVFADAFGYTLQETGLKVLTNASIIQGDAVSDRLLFESIYPAMVRAGFCPSNLAIGMGEENHRALRSEMEHAYKTSAVGVKGEDGLGGIRDVMKGADSRFKRSLPGPVSAHFEPGSFARRIRAVSLAQLRAGETGDLVVVYDGRRRPLRATRELFEESRRRCWRTWEELPADPGDTIDPAIRARQEQYLASMTGD